MTDLRHVRTARLRLDAVRVDDSEAVFALNADARLWEHLPSGRHTSVDQTRTQLERYATAWDDDGLGYWTARDREDDRVVGIGGVTLREGTVWNVYYRFAVEAQGRGLAHELASAALDAARAVRPDVPVVAYLLEHNTASRRLAERLGLTLVWRGPDVGNPDPDAVRLVLADRPLDEDALAVMTTSP
ncbi:GNAT family N-acetyltransferase [Cellulomonas fimi]|uniref:GNAT family N-acetyltransferase n=1 Tax=Cellulomonas fimi TaxID=1708 RepID=UPI00234E334D|nr:GNAT family N-acetyltransferase [Cellulomonas fimi]MDC7121116.1 GNAT family N-acetyltransferase [Cellulomonas fimi]